MCSIAFDKGNSYMLWEQCSLLSHEGWVPWWDSRVGLTPHVRGGSIALGAPKFFPFDSIEERVVCQNSDVRVTYIEIKPYFVFRLKN